MTRLDKFIINGILYDYLPANFTEVTDNYGLRANSNLMLDNGVISYTLPNNMYTDSARKRKVARQAWTADFTGESLIPLDMHDYLFGLYTTGQCFWLQYDDIMARDGCILIPDSANTYDGSEQVFYTPTYPIAPYGDEAGDRRQYWGCVTVNDVILTTGLAVNSELGVVKITGSLASTDVVRMAYTWKSYVIIKSLMLDLVSQDAQSWYTGQIVFEQVAPNYSKEYALTTLSSVTISLGTLQSIPSVVSEGWQDTRYLSIPSTPSVGVASVPSYTSNVGYPLSLAGQYSEPLAEQTLYWVPYWNTIDDKLTSEPATGYCWMANADGGQATECYSYNIYNPVTNTLESAAI